MESIVPLLANKTFKGVFATKVDDNLRGKSGRFPSSDGTTEGEIGFSSSDDVKFSNVESAGTKWQGQFTCHSNVTYQGRLAGGDRNEDIEHETDGKTSGSFELSLPDGVDRMDAEDLAEHKDVRITITDIESRP